MPTRREFGRISAANSCGSGERATVGWFLLSIVRHPLLEPCRWRIGISRVQVSALMVLMQRKLGLVASLIDDDASADRVEKDLKSFVGFKTGKQDGLGRS